MPQYAPELPTTQTLHDQYPLGEQAAAQIHENRAHLSAIIAAASLASSVSSARAL